MLLRNLKCSERLLRSRLMFKLFSSPMKSHGFFSCIIKTSSYIVAPVGSWWLSLLLFVYLPERDCLHCVGRNGCLLRNRQEVCSTRSKWRDTWQDLTFTGVLEHFFQWRLCWLSCRLALWLSFLLFPWVTDWIFCHSMKVTLNEGDVVSLR